MVRALARVAVVFAVAAVSSAEAGVKTEQKTQVQFGGLLGGIMNKFGGKAAKEGLVDTVAVVGDRKLTLNESTGQIVDLAEEKIYDLDVTKKTYTVTTFAELKKRIEEQRAKAEKEAAEAKEKAAKQEKDEPQAAAKEFEVDFEMKETGEKRAIAGVDARQVVMTATVRGKGQTLPQSGGVVLKTDTWLAPKIAAMKEIEEFDRRYALKMAELLGLAGPSGVASMEQMTAILAMYPGIQTAMEKVKAESAKVNMEGTPVATVLTVTGVKSAAQVQGSPEAAGRHRRRPRRHAGAQDDEEAGRPERPALDADDVVDGAAEGDADAGSRRTWAPSRSARR